MKRMNITITDNIFEDLVYLSNTEKINKSEVIRKAITLYKKKLIQDKTENEKWKKAQNAFRKINLIRESTSEWNGVKEIRKLRDSRAAR